MSLHRRFGADGWRFYPFRLQNYNFFPTYTNKVPLFPLFSCTIDIYFVPLQILSNNRLLVGD